jgi:hypothetical protein
MMVIGYFSSQDKYALRQHNLKIMPYISAKLRHCEEESHPDEAISPT